MKLSTLLISLVSSASLFQDVAFAKLENNLAYLSPSKTIRSLEIPVTRIKARSLLDNRGTDEYFKGNVTFDYGVAAGDPKQDSIILWTKADKYDTFNSNPPVCVKWQVSSNDFSHGDSKIVAHGEAHTSVDVDYTVKVEATGLKPYTRYYYRFFNCAGDDAGSSDVGTFKTLPADDDVPEHIRMAVFSCSNYPNGYFNAYGHASKHSEDLDYVQHIGDYIYEYKPETEIGRYAAPDRECTSLQDYRDRYATYRTDPDLLRLHKNVAWQMVWDDHELANNDYNKGSMDSNDTWAGIVNGVNFTQRKANAVRAYFEWMPIRQVDTDDKLRIWRNFDIGKLASLVMVDTRKYDRDVTDLGYNMDELEKLVNRTDRSIMGEKQEDWLRTQLSSSQENGSIWKIVGNQVIFAHLNMATEDGEVQFNYDAWDGYRASQQRMLKHIEDSKIQNVIWITGDSHSNWVSEIVPVDSSKYDSATGEGSIAVEFAGTAVSSSSGYEAETDQEYIDRAKQLINQNNNLKFAEGNLRGYFTLDVAPDVLSATYYGFYDQTTRNSNVTEIATFQVEKDTNKLKRPFNDGKQVSFGALGKQN